MRGRRLAGVQLRPRNASVGSIWAEAPVFIDATYEGDLAAMAGASFRIGRESRDEFGEPHAGRIYMNFGSTELLPGSTGAGDKAIQSYCFRFTATTDPSNRVPVIKTEHYSRSDYHWLLEDIRAGKITRFDQVFGVFPLPCGKVELNSLNPVPKTGVPSESSDLAEECWLWPEASHRKRAAIYRRYLAHNTGLVWMLQNDPEIPQELREDSLRYGWCKDEFVNHDHVPRQVYVREGRRINGEYLLKEQDGNLAPGWQRTEVQPASIAIVEWEFDSHACHRYDPAHPGTREGYTFVPHAPLQVPYGVVVPREVNGLLVPVACSCTHIAYNALRMEPVFAILGETCARAADLALKHGAELRDVSTAELQHDVVMHRGAITYFEDLTQEHPAFAAMQWLGARGFNTGYRALAEQSLTVTEAEERMARIGTFLKLKPSAPSKDNTPLGMVKAVEILRLAGLNNAVAKDANERVLTIAEFAQLIYDALHSESV